MAEFFRIYFNKETQESFISDVKRDDCVLIKLSRSMIEAEADLAYFKELYDSLDKDTNIPDAWGKLLDAKFSITPSDIIGVVDKKTIEYVEGEQLSFMVTLFGEEDKND